MHQALEAASGKLQLQLRSFYTTPRHSTLRIRRVYSEAWGVKSRVAAAAHVHKAVGSVCTGFYFKAPTLALSRECRNLTAKRGLIERQGR